jgi:hypothetical protein
MRKTGIGIVIGLALASIIYVPLVLVVQRGVSDSRRQQAQLEGGLRVFGFLDPHCFKTSAPSSEPKDVYHLKDRSLYIIEKDGVVIVETE